MITEQTDEWGDGFRRGPKFKFVGIRVEIFRIYDVEAAGSNFTADFEVFLEWDDPAYVGVENKGRNSGCFDIRSNWEPDWYV